jgi:hypothetical protein
MFHLSVTYSIFSVMHCLHHCHVAQLGNQTQIRGQSPPASSDVTRAISCFLGQAAAAAAGAIRNIHPVQVGG